MSRPYEALDVPVDGGALHARRWHGGSDGPVVLLLHGVATRAGKLPAARCSRAPRAG